MNQQNFSDAIGGLLAAMSPGVSIGSCFDMLDSGVAQSKNPSQTLCAFDDTVTSPNFGSCSALSPTESDLLTPFCESDSLFGGKVSDFSSFGSELFSAGFGCCGGSDPQCPVCSPQINTFNSFFGSYAFSGLPDFPPALSASDPDISICVPNMIPSPCSASNSFSPLSLSADFSAERTLSVPSSLNTKSTDKHRERCDKRFLESLPPQLALKRKRPRPSKRRGDIDKLSPGVRDNEPIPSCDSLFGLGDNLPLDSKRNKNTDAARRSRLRKALKLDALESQVIELELENTSLKESIKNFESERLKFSEREELLKEQIRSMNMLLMSALHGIKNTPSP
ncbi:hypothetical protein AYI68_g3921 [Smittium mucronatum]|uniref:BZIP domain-containing protein n=1 Tax=Smittium mucronatum TaxID=133383 RepID=A0A1R0GYK8_9FUNG|nr:hypothetical protein AYI68_g3921 [Smittium mucronatum]